MSKKFVLNIFKCEFCLLARRYESAAVKSAARGHFLRRIRRLELHVGAHLGRERRRRVVGAGRRLGE